MVAFSEMFREAAFLQKKRAPGNNFEDIINTKGTFSQSIVKVLTFIK
jgi:hypothetical protein